jgi:hypothetical protein
MAMYAEKTFETVIASLEARRDVTACSMLLSISGEVLCGGSVIYLTQVENHNSDSPVEYHVTGNTRYGRP